MIKTLLEYIKRLRELQQNLLLEMQALRKLKIESIGLQKINKSSNSFARTYSRKGLSQSDEDGLLAEILHRILTSSERSFIGSFIELGVGNGLENNTLSLLLGGWKGTWISGQPIDFEVSSISDFLFINEWITKDNICGLVLEGLSRIGLSSDGIDCLSIDLDGNDYYILEALLGLKEFKPKVIIAEYNAAFGPNIIWKQGYDDSHKWDFSQHFGASFGALVMLADIYGYIPICCNPRTGANVFFTLKEYEELFPEIPKSNSLIFEEGFYMVENKFLHSINKDIIKSICQPV